MSLIQAAQWGTILGPLLLLIAISLTILTLAWLAFRIMAAEQIRAEAVQNLEQIRADRERLEVGKVALLTRGKRA